MRQFQPHARAERSSTGNPVASAFGRFYVTNPSIIHKYVLYPIWSESISLYLEKSAFQDLSLAKAEAIAG